MHRSTARMLLTAQCGPPRWPAAAAATCARVHRPQTLPQYRPLLVPRALKEGGHLLTVVVQEQLGVDAPPAPSLGAAGVVAGRSGWAAQAVLGEYADPECAGGGPEGGGLPAPGAAVVLPLLTARGGAT